MVTITRLSTISLTENTMDLPMTQAEFHTAYTAWKGGMLIQNAFPMLSPVQREFLMSGMSEAEQNEFFGNFEEA